MHKEFFALLKKDHQAVKSILKEIQQSTDRAEQARQKLLEKLKLELLPHMEGEERAFYPALKEAQDSRDGALEMIEEHQVAKVVLSDLDRTPKTNENWKAKVVVLKDLIEHHVEVEESKAFKMAQDVLSEEDIQNIMRQFQQEKDKALAQKERVTQRAM